MLKDFDKVLGLYMTTDVLPCNQSQLFSDTNFFEYSAMLLNSPIVLNHLKAKTNPQTAGDEYCAKKSELQNYAKPRLEELEHWIDSGGTLAVFLNEFKEISFASGGRPSPPEVATLEDFFPFNLLRYKRRSGSSVTYIGPSRYRQIFTHCAELMDYKMTLNGETVEPLFGVGGSASRQIVGGFVPRNKGMMIFLPITKNWSEGGGDSNATRDVLVKASLDFVTAYKAKAQDLPTFHVNYMLPTERATVKKIEELENKVEAIKAKILESQETLADLKALKHLLFGHDDEFEDAVLHCLKTLKLKSRKGPKAHADILSWSGGTLLVVEAKGVLNSARESHTGQCLRWAGEARQAYTSSTEELSDDAVLKAYCDTISALGAPKFDEENMISIKGVMVIGTYRAKPLEDRTEPDFPDAMLRNVRSNNVCAMTGMQLLCMYCHIVANPKDRGRVQKKLMETAGVLDEFKDWEQYIDLINSA